MPCFVQQELVYFTFSRHSSSSRTVALEVLLQRCNEVQLWVMTEVLLCRLLCKRVQLIKKFIKIAAQLVAHVQNLLFNHVHLHELHDCLVNLNGDATPSSGETIHCMSSRSEVPKRKKRLGTSALMRLFFMDIFLSFFISCKAQKNLNCFFAIIMGLNTAAVSRLSQTWEVRMPFFHNVCNTLTANTRHA